MYHLEILHKPYSAEDLEAIREINQANIPEVSHIESIDRLKQLINWSSHTIVVRDSEIAGFIILMREHQEYESPNYDFYNNKNEPFLYVDRIAIELGKELEVNITCEVNTIPRNEPSLAFHAGFGFEAVGTKDYEDHSVVYLTKFLHF